MTAKIHWLNWLNTGLTSNSTKNRSFWRCFFSANIYERVETTQLSCQQHVEWHSAFSSSCERSHMWMRSPLVYSTIITRRLVMMFRINRPFRHRHVLVPLSNASHKERVLKIIRTLHESCHKSQTYQIWQRTFLQSSEINTIVYIVF